MEEIIEQLKALYNELDVEIGQVDAMRKHQMALINDLGFTKKEMIRVQRRVKDLTDELIGRVR